MLKALALTCALPASAAAGGGLSLDLKLSPPNLDSEVPRGTRAGTAALAEHESETSDEETLYMDPGPPPAADGAPHAPRLPARVVPPMPAPAAEPSREAAPLGMGIGERLITSRLLPREGPPRPTSR